MSLAITQVTLARPGRSAHWVGIRLDCPHGSTPRQVSLLDAMRLSEPSFSAVVLQRIRQLMHSTVADHRRATGCVCAAPLALFCWPRLDARHAIEAAARRSTS